MSVRPFRIDIPQATLDDLHAKLAAARLPEGMPGAGWDYGTSPDYLRELCSYWRLEFDWRKQENYLNSFSHFETEIDNARVHFIHEKGRGKDAIPLLLLHGWPDSFARFLKLIPLLTDPEANGAPDAPSFDVIVPSLPGFGFSERPHKAGATFGFGDLFHKLMVDELGYRRFAIQGGDFGSMIAELLGRSHAESVVGIHLTDVPFMHLMQQPNDPTPAEKKFFDHLSGFQQKESAYALIQSTKPETLACGLNDSPAGLASWIVEKFRAWSDSQGEISGRFTRDELLTNIMIYWSTQTIDSSFFPYFDLANAGALRWISEGVKGWLGSKDVPTGFAIFPKDLTLPPRELAERFFNVHRWTEMPRGGHFAALEEPELLAQDLRAMFGPLWARETIGPSRRTEALENVRAQPR